MAKITYDYLRYELVECENGLPHVFNYGIIRKSIETLKQFRYYGDNNEKNYPDIKSLVLMSEVFQVSLDNLVKGDLERMKKEIDTQEYAKFQKDSTIFTVLFIALLIVPIPLVMLWKWFGMALYLCLFGIGMYFAVRIEKYKKKYDIQTFKEIVAFTDGKSLDEIEKAREEGKRPYQKALLVAGSAALAVIIALIMTAVMRLFS